MLPWLPFERRWRDALLGAVIPRLEGGTLPGLREVPLGAFFERFDRAAPPALRLAFRAAVWALTFLPALAGRWRLFPGLDADEQDRFLRRAASHHAYPVRQLVLTIEIIACWAYFGDVRVRGRFAAPPSPGRGGP